MTTDGTPLIGVRTADHGFPRALLTRTDWASPLQIGHSSAADRTSPLPSRSPLLNGSPLTTSTPDTFLTRAIAPAGRPMIRTRSPKAARFARELHKVTPALVARAGGRCELAHLEGCEGRLHRHHRLMRSQGGTNDLSNLLLVCDRHHRYLHAEPALSYAQGWLVKWVR
jgi:hypothetical protein